MRLVKYASIYCINDPCQSDRLSLNKRHDAPLLSAHALDAAGLPAERVASTTNSLLVHARRWWCIVTDQRMNNYLIIALFHQQDGQASNQRTV